MNKKEINIDRQAEHVKLSVVIPCYNEKKTIKEIINKIRQVSIKGVEIEIVIVDDCSTDGTREILKNELANLVDKVIYHETNLGKGAALRTGFGETTGNIVIVQDADLEYDPAEYQTMISPIMQNQADVVYGSRFMGGLPHRVVFFWHMVGNRLITMMSNMFTNLNLTDIETCYKAFRREVIQSIEIEENRFGFEPEITAKLANWPNCELRIYEVGISYYGRTYQEGKKIGWRDGFSALYCILKYNLWKTKGNRYKSGLLKILTLSVLISLYSGTKACKQEARRLQPRLFHLEESLDEISGLDKRFKKLQHLLPASEVVDYVSDQPDDVRTYYLIQYAIAPVFLAPGSNSSHVIVHCHEAHRLKDLIAKHDISVLKQIDEKTALCKRKND